MKVRFGFVSNSSSSSFVCEICGHTETGYDASLEDVGFVQCEHAHIFCDEHVINTDEGVEYEDEYDEYLKAKHCPICQFEEYSQSELVTYLVKEYNIPKDLVFSEIKAINKRRKKLYDHEYIEYVFKKNNLTDDIILQLLKDKFKNYNKFNNYIYGEIDED